MPFGLGTMTGAGKSLRFTIRATLLLLNCKYAAMSSSFINGSGMIIKISLSSLQILCGVHLLNSLAKPANYRHGDAVSQRFVARRIGCADLSVVINVGVPIGESL